MENLAAKEKTLLIYSGGFNKHQWQTKRVGYLAHRGQLLFSKKKKQLV